VGRGSRKTERYREASDIHPANSTVRPNNVPSRGSAIDRRLGTLNGLTAPIAGEYQMLRLNRRAIREPRPTRFAGAACLTPYLAFLALKRIPRDL
jgi:hypothetical protein